MIGFSLLWWVLLLCSTKSNNNVLYFSLVFFLSIVVGFRGIEVCPDTQTYEVIYNSVVVIVGAVNMLKSHTNPVNISITP